MLITQDSCLIFMTHVTVDQARVCVCMHGQVLVYAQAHECGDQGTTSDVTPNMSSTIFLRQILLLAQSSPSRLDWRASEPQGSTYLFSQNWN